jgi:hypothetical protein
MMLFRKILISCIVLALTIQVENLLAAGSPFGLPARRLPGVSSSYYTQKLDNELSLFKQDKLVSVRSSAISYDQVDWNSVPDLHLNDDIAVEIFQLVRDMRFIDHEGDFETIRKRRATWLYPDDGCFARSALSQSLIKSSGKISAVFGQIFIFGDLQAKTPNNEDGWVTWWYHVAPIYKSNGVIYIIDPAVNPKKILLLDEWLDLVSIQKSNLKISLCDEKSYDPTSPCFGNEDNTLERALSAENNLFLDAELQRIQDLNRNPEQELGDAPPWLIELY